MAQEAKLRPGDRVRVICEEEASLCVDRTIGETGIVKLPLIGGITLAGSTPSEAASNIRAAMRRRAPDFGGGVRVLRLAATDAPITYSGAVKRGGEAPFAAGMRLSAIVQLAEPTISAELEAVQITSATGDTITVDSTDPGGDPELRSGDHVYFPLATRPREVIVVGGVARPGSVPYRRGVTVQEALSAVGGVTGHGLADQIKLLREGKEIATLDGVKDGATVLLRGDVLQVGLVEKRLFVTVIGYVKNPGLVEFRAGMTLSQVIEAAGGLAKDAAPDIIEVRTVVAPGYGVKRYDLDKILSGAAKDVVLKSSEVVAVPPTSYRSVVKPPPQKGKRQVVPPSEAVR